MSKFKIVEVGKHDAFYEDRHEIEGKIVEGIIDAVYTSINDYVGARLYKPIEVLGEPDGAYSFAFIKVEIIE